MPFTFDCKPNITICSHFIDKFEEGPRFEDFIANLILDEGEEVKKITIADLWIAQDIPEGVCQGCFNFK